MLLTPFGEVGREAGAEMVEMFGYSLAALESLRQEAGYILVSSDHDKNTNPFEAGIGFSVKLNKPDFNGKAALQKISEVGVRRRLVWFDLASGSVANVGDAIAVQRNRIGQVTIGPIPIPASRHSYGICRLRTRDSWSGRNDQQRRREARGHPSRHGALRSRQGAVEITVAMK